MEETDAQNIIEKIKIEEGRAKRRMYLFTSIPFLLTLILIGASWYAVNQADQKVKEKNRMLDETDKKVNELRKIINSKNDSIIELKKIYDFAITYKDKRFTFDYSIDKNLFSSFPRQAQLLVYVRELISDNVIKWNLGGNSIEQGFDSPGFAAYLLNRFTSSKVPVDKTYKLMEYLPKTTQPNAGDIVFYEHGYTMFYFTNRNESFCVGMTPIGVSSLKLDFGPEIIGYGKVDYRSGL